MNRRNVLLGSIAALVATQIPFVPKSKAAEQVLLWAPTIWQYKFIHRSTLDMITYSVHEQRLCDFHITIGCPIDRFLCFSQSLQRDKLGFTSFNFTMSKDPTKIWSFKTYQSGGIGVYGFVEATDNDIINGPVVSAQYVLDHIDDYKQRYSHLTSRIYDMSKAHWMDKDQWLRETKQVKGT